MCLLSKKTAKFSKGGGAMLKSVVTDMGRIIYLSSYYTRRMCIFLESAFSEKSRKKKKASTIIITQTFNARTSEFTEFQKSLAVQHGTALRKYKPLKRKCTI